ncbi:MAG: cation:proton antiporter [Actinobacteria bacterium]|nr:cation:proton antiporter [Actinomycetota bacterium]
MHEVTHFGAVILLVSSAFAIAVLSNKLSERLRIPAAGLFLVAAALASDAWPRLAHALSIRDVERIAVIALIVILFDGGMRVGWARFRESALPIVSLGLLGTFATAGLMMLAAHYLLDFSWQTSGLLGAALAPTDPAVMFSVFGRKEISGRTGTILEGESGANDPVGIALMLAAVSLAQTKSTSVPHAVGEFLLELSVGTAVGIAGAYGLLLVMRRIVLPNPALYPLRTLAFAGVIYGLATVAHGSGFLAVYIAGIFIGDADLPAKRGIERFHTSLASLAEIVVFIGLGLTVDLTALGDNHRWLDGLVLAAVLAIVVRPLAVGPLLMRFHLTRNERLFVMWSGLKGAVPILLAAFVVLGGVKDAYRIYEIVFVVVAFSVLLQGASVPWAAKRLGIPMRTTTPV